MIYTHIYNVRIIIYICIYIYISGFGGYIWRRAATVGWRSQAVRPSVEGFSVARIVTIIAACHQRLAFKAHRLCAPLNSRWRSQAVRPSVDGFSVARIVTRIAA